MIRRVIFPLQFIKGCYYSVLLIANDVVHMYIDFFLPVNTYFFNQISQEQVQSLNFKIAHKLVKRIIYYTISVINKKHHKRGMQHCLIISKVFRLQSLATISAKLACWHQPCSIGRCMIPFEIKKWRRKLLFPFHSSTEPSDTETRVISRENAKPV